MTQKETANRVHVIRDLGELGALRTPTRHRVLNAILELGPCSVAEIADRLGWKPESLYYHVNALLEVGLILRAGERPSGPKTEALYQAVAHEIVLDQRNRTPEYLGGVWDAYRAALRATERDLERALVSEKDGVGPRKNTMLHQATVRVSSPTAERLRAMLNEVVRFAIENEDRGASESISLTLALSRVRQEQPAAACPR